MAKKIRKSDVALGSAIVPLIQKIPATIISENPAYLELVSKVPEWFFWISVGFALAAWIFDPWRNNSRLMQFWHWLNDDFEVERIIVGQRMIEQGHDLVYGVHVCIRLLRNMKRGKLVLRVFSCVGRNLGEEVLTLRDLSGGVKGQKSWITLASYPLPKARQAASAGRWGDVEEKVAFIRESENVAILETPGRFSRQQYKIFVGHRSPEGSNYDPVIYAHGQDDDIFDESGSSRINVG
tara:strand:- start:687 stop:1400 length:714 start_codon:yes stop_codon:yes gene_type:complete